MNTVTLKTEQDKKISAVKPDWKREKSIYGKFEPGKKLIKTIRAYQAIRMKKSIWARVAGPCFVLQHRFWSAFCGTDIPLNSNIGGGILIPHPNGIVIHPEAVIGPNCLIFQQVTIGAGSLPGTPYIEGHVDIGAGAKILGGVRIGKHTCIGANAVVLDNIPESCMAAGIPARIVKRY